MVKPTSIVGNRPRIHHDCHGHVVLLVWSIDVHHFKDFQRFQDARMMWDYPRKRCSAPQTLNINNDCAWATAILEQCWLIRACVWARHCFTNPACLFQKASMLELHHAWTVPPRFDALAWSFTGKEGELPTLTWFPSRRIAAIRYPNFFCTIAMHQVSNAPRPYAS